MVQKEFFGIDYDIFYHIFCIKDSWFIWFHFLGYNNGPLYSINKEILNHCEALDIAHEAKIHHQQECLYKMMCSFRDKIKEEFPVDEENEEERLKNYLKSMKPIIPKKNKS